MGASGPPSRLGNLMRSPWTVRVAAWSARHRWPVFVLWFAGTLGTLGAGFAAGGIYALDVNDDPNGPKLRSETAYDVLGAGEPVAPAERLVVVIDGGSGAATDPAFKACPRPRRPGPDRRAGDRRWRERPTFDEVVDPFVAPPQAGLISPDGTTVQVVGSVPVSARSSSRHSAGPRHRRWRPRPAVPAST